MQLVLSPPQLASTRSASSYQMTVRKRRAGAAGGTAATHVECHHLDEDGVVFDVAARLQDALRHKQRTSGGDVHLSCGTSEAAAVWIRLKGVAQVFP